REITPAAVAATLAIIAIFIPVVFMKGIIGKFFFQFGVTMSAAVGLSLIEALTLTPMRASRFLKENHEDGRFARLVNRTFDGCIRFYSKSLKTCLNHRWVVIFFAILLFAASFVVFPHPKKEFVPAQDQSAFLIRVQTPLGSSIDYTDGLLKKAEAIITATPEVERYYSAVGGFGGGDVNTGMVFLTLKDQKERREI